ncbi:glycoside hydrolase family 1 protein [Clostridium sp. 1001271st1 H5]|uniref:glycoside hydrolase family 1 protein n=1 Tax=unclassified Clostridium TaxID=2614128 RepID=UPI00110649F8|nr:glycoside hydrolase family 1 protein [Clostridium sp. 1001271st1 H5]
MNDFLWGGATASYQCEGGWQEGGRVESMWDVYLHENHLENGDVASDHYHRFREDIRMMKEGGQNSYRFSLAWPRIIRNREGEVNQEGIDFYNQLIDACLEYGITPMVTIFHWDLPQYLEEKGGWLNRETCAAYTHYAKICFDRFGDRVKLWATFNEPRYYTNSGYLIGNYPPGHQDIQETVTASYYMMLASAMAVEAFRAGGYDGQIGIVHSFSPVYTMDTRVESAIAERFADNFYNNWILDTAALGEIPGDLLGELKKTCDLSMMTPEDLAVIRRNRVDYLGLNYYARVMVKPYESGETTLIVNNQGKKAKGTSQTIIKGWFEQVRPESSRYTEWDTEIFPEGLYEGIRRVWNKYHLPIYITENGIGLYEDISVSQVEDDDRIEFMDMHIAAVLKAKEGGCDVRGYYAWSPFDLYSWKNGTEKRYGLVAIDYENGLERRPKKSYYWYKDVIETEGKHITGK